MTLSIKNVSRKLHFNEHLISWMSLTTKSTKIQRNIDEITVVVNSPYLEAQYLVTLTQIDII